MRQDDRTLEINELLRVEKAATALLHRADAWGRIPIPIEDVLAAAKLKVAKHSMFDPRVIAGYAIAVGQKATQTVKRALGKLFGLLDAEEDLIHIDQSVLPQRQTFLTLHETGHSELPHQKKLFRFFEESEQELDPSIADLFEREANNFARFMMFNGNQYSEDAASLPCHFGTVKTMQRRYKVSLYASLREFARTHRYPCIAMAVETPELGGEDGFKAAIRRVEVSASFEASFGRPTAPALSRRHVMGKLVPLGWKATKPTKFSLTDRNGDTHEFIGEALDTGFNILLFACPVSAFKK